MGELLKRWGRINGHDTAYIQISLDDYDAIWPSWGRTMGVMMQFYDKSTKNNWGLGQGEELVTMQELGVDGLVGLDETLRLMGS